MKASHSPFIFLFLLFHQIYPFLLNGCLIDNNLCETEEICISDGLFGECTDGKASLIMPDSFDEIELQKLRTELSESLDRGWDSAKLQCIITYFKLTKVFELKYDDDFCNVRNPANVWEMLQLVKRFLLQPELIPVQEYTSEGSSNYSVNGDLPKENSVYTGEIDGQTLEENQNNSEDTGEDREIQSSLADDKVIKYLERFLRNQLPDLNEIENDENQRDRLAKYVHFIQNALRLQNYEGNYDAGEAEKMVPLSVENDDTPPFKKDIEHLGNQNTGLGNIEHKIVKGSREFQKVDGSRVYLKISKDLNEENVYQLTKYLNDAVALPNQLFFSDFQFDDGQLSFHVGRSRYLRSPNVRQLDDAAGIAKIVYKRRKDIEVLSGVHVDETGIGDGMDTIPIQNDGSEDQFFTPILLICATTVMILIVVLAGQQVRHHRRKRSAANVSDLAEKIEGKALSTYQDLCRSRMGNEPRNDINSKSSSISSWSEEPISDCSMNVSTGHAILAFLQDYLQTPGKIEEEWKTLINYTVQNSSTSIAEREDNKDKNRDSQFLPYDENLVPLLTISTESLGTYINASAIHDSDPTKAVYITTQSPLPQTIVDFWQMIWEQGVALIVNLTNEEDVKSQCCSHYWPENGSQIYGTYEIHLVSEHIWSEDYLVRSFYLKNLRTNETRTVTQFHYLTWPEEGVPSSTKSLLDFRRKVNKSYRGHSAPTVIHCTNGYGRTGAYCLLDIVLNRISKGIKELNVVGSLEFLRDQRAAMVENVEQYKMVLSCVAEEVTAMIKALPK